MLLHPMLLCSKPHPFLLLSLLEEEHDGHLPAIHPVSADSPLTPSFLPLSSLPGFLFNLLLLLPSFLSIDPVLLPLLPLPEVHEETRKVSGTA